MGHLGRRADQAALPPDASTLEAQRLRYTTKRYLSAGRPSEARKSADARPADGFDAYRRGFF